MKYIYFLVLALFISCKADTSGTTAKTDTTTKSTVSAEKKKGAQENNIRSTNATEGKKPKATDRGVQSQIEEYANSTPTITSATTVKKGKSVKTNFNSEGIPDACDLMTPETVGKAIGINPSSINITDGSSSKSKLQRACFFKWDGSSIKNAGVMVQLQKNPVADDVPDYFTYMITSKKTEGENDFAGGKKFKYKDWPGFGTDAAYSTDAGKYVWRVDNEWAFMIAFNTTLSPKKQKKAAEILAKEVMSRMTF